MASLRWAYVRIITGTILGGVLGFYVMHQVETSYKVSLFSFPRSPFCRFACLWSAIVAGEEEGGAEAVRDRDGKEAARTGASSDRAVVGSLGLIHSVLSSLSQNSSLEQFTCTASQVSNVF